MLASLWRLRGLLMSFFDHLIGRPSRQGVCSAFSASIAVNRSLRWRRAEPAMYSMRTARAARNCTDSLSAAVANSMILPAAFLRLWANWPTARSRV